MQPFRIFLTSLGVELTIHSTHYKLQHRSGRRFDEIRASSFPRARPMGFARFARQYFFRPPTQVRRTWRCVFGRDTVQTDRKAGERLLE